MKKTVLLLSAMLFSSAASADLYLGLKKGTVDYDAPGFGSASNTSVVGGYEIVSLGFDLAVEAEYMTSSKGDAPFGQQYSVDSLGAYVATRTPGPIYLKLRGGLSNTTFTVNGNETSETQPMVSLGTGFSLLGLVAMELDYTVYQSSGNIKNATNMLSLGARFF